MARTPPRPSPAAARSRPFALPAFLAGLALLPAAGCKPDDEIRHYTVPRAAEPPPVPAAAAGPLQRTLGAVFDRGAEKWFFKLSGTEEAVGGHAKEFDAFVDSVRFTDDKEKLPEWKVPDGWKQGPATQFSVASFRLGDGAEAPRLTVTRASGSLRDNVNRWRGQLGLKPLGDEELAKTVKEKKVGGVAVTVVDLTGHGSGGMGVKPPFAGGALPPGHPPAAPGKKPLTYTTPEGWEEQPTGGGGAGIARAAAFTVARDGQKAEVTVIPLGGSVGGELDNVNRWRGQIGLAPVREAGGEAVTVAGKPGRLFDIAGEGAKAQRMLVVMLPHGRQTWFFKMTGPAELVGREKAAFEKFVQSVQFAGGGADE